ncbi:MAG: HAD family phosphatase [Bryobacteraceae bacterium]
MIKCVIFDLGNVLVPFDFAHAYERMERVSALDRGEIRKRMLDSGLAPRLESGKIEPHDFVAQVNALMGVDLSFDEFRDIWVSIFERRTLIPEQTLASIRSRYRTVLLSNTNAIHFDWVAENYPHLGHFDQWVLSHRVGAMKPEPAIFAEAIRAAGCAPGECFFTDDVPEYVAGAKAMGIDAEPFVGFEALKQHLVARGISFE